MKTLLIYRMMRENCWPQDRTDLYSLSVVSSVFPLSEGPAGVWPVCLGHLGLPLSPEEAAFRCEHEQASLDPGEDPSLPDVGLEPHGPTQMMSGPVSNCKRRRGCRHGECVRDC